MTKQDMIELLLRAITAQMPVLVAVEGNTLLLQFSTGEIFRLSIV